MSVSYYPQLQALADEAYRTFTARIVPTGYRMLGVRLPALKQLAAEIARGDGLADYLDAPVGNTYEEVLLYGLVLGRARLPQADLFARLDTLIPLMDNWAHVDCVVSAVKAMGKDPDATLAHFLPLAEGGVFARRFLVIVLMDYVMTAERLHEVLALYARLQGDDYYVNMGIAWALSVALVKYYDRTLAALQSGAYNDFVHNKAIQKARESFRLQPWQKARLSALKRKAQ